MHRAALALLCIVASGDSVEAQTKPSAAVVTPWAKRLLDTPGPRWETTSSRHFLLFAERGEHPHYNPATMLDSLEAAWQHAATLLQGTPADQPVVNVLVTRSRVRLASALPASNKGTMILGNRDHGETVVLIFNDSVRPYYRHEVMHVVSSRAWGHGQVWAREGLATWADGRCLGRNIATVARDALRREPELRPEQFIDEFIKRVDQDRMGSYAIAASLLQYVHDRGGMPAVRRVWQAGLTVLNEPTVSDSTRTSWRTFVEWSTAGQLSVPQDSLKRFGCG